MITSHQRRANDRRRAEHNLRARIGRDSGPASREGLDDDMVELLERAGVRFAPRSASSCADWVEANLDVELAPWQRAVLDHDGPFEYGRRSGRTQLDGFRRLWLNACVEQAGVPTGRIGADGQEVAR